MAVGTVGGLRSRPGFARPSELDPTTLDADLTLTIGGVDAMPYLQAHSPKVRQTATGKSVNGTFRFQLQGTPANLAGFQPEQEVIWSDRGVRLFGGLLKVRTPSDVSRRDWLVLDCECQDFSSILDAIIIPDGGLHCAGDSDEARVRWLVDTYGSAAGLTDIHVYETMTPLPEVDYRGMTLREALKSITDLTGAVCFVDDEKDVHYLLDADNSAPFDLADAPNHVDTFGFKDRTFTWPVDTATLKNAIYGIPGTGAGDAIPTWYEDAASIAAYGRKEGIFKDDTITAQASLDLAATAFLNANAQPLRAGTATVFEPGLKAGQWIRVTNLLHGLYNERVRINEINTTYPIDATAPGGRGPEFAIVFAGVMPELNLKKSATAAGGSPYFSLSRPNSYKNIVLADRPLRYFRLDEAVGSTHPDLGTDHEDAIDYDDTGMSSIGPLVADGHAMRYGNPGTGYTQATSFGDGTTGSNGPLSISIEFWVRVNGAGFDNPGIGARGRAVEWRPYSGIGINPYIWVGTQSGHTDGGFIGWNLSSSDPSPTGASASEPDALPGGFGTIHHVVLTHHAGSLTHFSASGHDFVSDGQGVVKLYIDGVLYKTYAGQDSFQPQIAAPDWYFLIGATFYSPDGRHHDWDIDEVAVYPYTLTAGQVAAHYSAGIGC